MTKRITNTEQPILSRDEALEMLSIQLRNPRLEPDVFLRVMSLYSKIAGWNEEEQPNKPEPTIEEQVRLAEKARRESFQSPRPCEVS